MTLDIVNKNATIYNSCPSYNKRIRPQIKVLIELLNNVYDLGIILEAEIKYFGNGDGWRCGYEGLWFCQHMSLNNKPLEMFSIPRLGRLNIRSQ